MKQIFTLFAVLIFSFFSVNAQINQTFESVSALSQLTGNCWQFSGVAFSTSSQVNGANNLEVLPVTNGTNGVVSTPYVSLPNAASISFNYKLNTKLATNATRSIAVKLQAYNGTTTALTSVALDKQTPTTTQSLSTASTTASGVYKIVIEISGSSDGNTSVYLDDISIAGAYNYSAPYNCNGTASGPLPVYLKNFQSSLQGEQVQLQWQVAENETGDYFELEKSADGRTFKTAAFVMATEKKGDEGYSYTENLLAATYYRLKIVNKNKSVSYSNVIFVKKQTAQGNALNLLQNPVKQNLQFAFNADRAGLADVAVYNVNGVKVWQTKFNVQKGLNNLSTDLQNVNMKGTYLLEVRTSETRSVVKFLKG